MDASELTRKLLFCGYDEATCYLNDSELNRYLYKKLIDIVPEHHIKVPIVTLFNEVYFQCVRVNYDGHPGFGIEYSYVDEEKRWLKSDEATQLVFATVLVLLAAKDEHTFNEECFMNGIAAYVKQGLFCDFANEVQDAIKDTPISVPAEFRAMPCPASEIPLLSIEQTRRFSNSAHLLLSMMENEGFMKQRIEWQEYNYAWIQVTDHYSHEIVKKYLELYSDPADKIQVIECIRMSFSIEDCHYYDIYFKRLEQEIKEQQKSQSVNIGGAPLHQTINITTAHQVNINPKEVINYLHEQIQEEIDRIGR